MFYSIDPFAPDTAPASPTARCPRCAFPLVIIPQGAATPEFHRALGEVLEFVETARDALDAIQGTIETVVRV